MKRTAKRIFNRRHGIKWGALGGLLGSGTALLQYIPQTWPTWIGVALTVAAFVASGVSSVVQPEGADA